jgi:hydrogenase/urease accessory protein HupE
MTLASMARRTALSATLCSAGGAFAHAGHDTAPTMGWLEGLMHLLTQPDHLWMLAGAAVFVVAALRARRPSKARARRT